MVIDAVRRGEPVDAVVFCDTGGEFDEIYRHIDAFDNWLNKEIGGRVIRIASKTSFEEYVFNFTPKRKPENKFYGMTGLGFPTFHFRWCNGKLKRDVLENWISKNSPNATINIGIAFDEVERRKKPKRNQKYPLVERMITERQAMNICQNEGFDFYGIYEKFPRTGCWFCPLQRVESYKKLFIHYPEKWRKLREWQSLAKERFDVDYLWKLGGKDLSKYEEKWSQDNE